MKRMEIAENKLTRRARRAVLAACLLTTLPALGCRSGSPSWNLFSGRGEPSAATLAGSGPTTTYPTPPSSRAKPEAIASIAGGTAPAQPTAPATPTMPNAPGAANPYALAGNRTNSLENSVPTGFPTADSSPSAAQPSGTAAAGNPTPSTTLANNGQAVPPAYALPGRSQPTSGQASAAAPPSYAAAAANGYPASTPPSQSPTAPPSAPSMPTGYQLGSKSPEAANTVATSTPNSSQPAANSNFELPPLNSLTPAQVASQAPAAQSTPSGSASGFMLPSDMPAATSSPVASAPAAKPTPTPLAPTDTPSSSSTAVAALDLPPSDPGVPTGESTPIAAADASDTPPAEYQTASASKDSKASDGTNSNDVQRTGYMPGSTSKSAGYPSPAPVRR